MQTNTKKTISIYWSHTKKYWLSFFGTIIAIILGVSGNLIPPLLYKEFFDVLSTAGVDAASASRLFHILYLVVLAYGGAWIFWRIAEFSTSYYQTKIMGDLTKSCYAYMHRHAFGFFENNFVGSLVKKVNRFYRSFERLADKLTWDLIPLITNITIITIVLFLQSPVIGLGLLAWVIFFVAINYWYSLFKLKYDIQRSGMDTRVTGILADSITNQGNVKLFSAFKREAAFFGGAVEKLQKLRRFTWDLGHIMNAVQAALMFVLEFAIMYFAIKLWGEGKITAGTFVLIQAYLLTVFHRLWDFGRIIRDTYEALADAEEMTEIINLPVAIQDVRNAKRLKVAGGAIEFRKVKFNYHKTRTVIPNLTLSVQSGERIGLVGPSGAGKSTIIKLLLRIVDTTSGDILIDGQSIRTATQDSLHDAIAMVPQDPVLFHRSLLENIAYGKPGASKKQVIAAAKAAHCHEFIQNFPDGYETYVGERGVKLSGGERQRVAIARAILKNAPILVLDEATSSLDSESESLIQDALNTLMKGKTSIVVAHRLSTIMSLDRIIVLDGGTIAEEGTHDELLEKKSGLYAKLWKYQAGGFIS